jgi:hypothetical protein
MDFVVHSWIYRTISNDLVETVLQPGAYARIIWLTVESQFLSNREQCALLFGTEFCTFVEADLSITEYYQRLKTMADALGGFSEDVFDRTLILNVIRGLNEKFSHIGVHLLHCCPLPTFLNARNELLLEDSLLANR